MTSRITWVFVAGSILPLLYIYLSFLNWYYHNPRFYPTTTIEMAILATQVLRLLVVVAVPRFRKAKFLVVLDVFTLEILLVPAMVVITLVEGGLTYIGYAGQIIWAWPPAFMMVFIPFAVYKLAAKVRQVPPISLTIPAAVSIFVPLAYLDIATTSYTQFDGLMGISKLLLAAIFGSILKPSIPAQVSTAGVALYLVLIVYAVSQGSESPPARSGLLAFAVVGTVAAIGWEAAARSFTSGEILIFGVPALALAGVIWGVTRAR
jgi:hypothetical protein